MGKIYKNYIDGVDDDAFRAELAKMGITDENAVTAAMTIANKVAEEAYWDGRDTGAELAERD
jgi:hypothetical protein